MAGGLWAGDDKERADREGRLIEVLKSGAGAAEKDLACRELQVIGSPASIPALAALLTDRELSHMARYALEPMPYPQVAQALREALPKAEPELKVGIIGSLGFRVDKESVPDLIPLLKDSDAAVVDAAAAALGRMATPEAAAALEKFRAAAAPAFQNVAGESSLALAERMVLSGRSEETVKIYEALLTSKWPVHIRQGAFVGYLRAVPGQASVRIRKAVEGKDAALKSVAVANIPSIKDPEAIRFFCTFLPKAPAEVKIWLIAALAECDPRLTLPAIIGELAGSVPEVRMAAVKALGRSGDATCVAALSRLLAGAADEALKKESVGSLERLRGAGITAELVTAMKAAEIEPRIQLMSILVSRRAADALDALFAEAVHADARVREAAFKAIGNLGSAEQQPALLKLMLAGRSAESGTDAELAIVRLARKNPDAGAQADAVLAALPTVTDTALQCSLLRILGGIANYKALDVMRTSLRSKVPEIRENALKALADWPDAKAVDLLLQELRRSGGNVNQQASLIRGCVKLLRRGDGLPSQTVARYRELLTLAPRPEDKVFILSGLAEVPDPAALKLAAPGLEDPRIRAEAELALMRIARRVMGAAPAEARQAAEKLKNAAQGEEIRRQAAEMISQIERSQGYLMAWRVTGPFTRMGGEGLRLYDIALAPETGDESLKWQDLTLSSRTENPWRVDVASFLGEGRMRAAYVRSWIFSQKAQDAVLTLEMDDPLKVWLNREIVYLHNVPPGSGTVRSAMTAALREGWNEVLIKVVQSAGPWEFSFKMEKTGGGPLDNIRWDAGYGDKVREGLLYEGKGSGWVQLFNGKDLTGWKQTGDAQFSVAEGNLVGIQTTGKGGDLYTEGQWEDFEMRALYRVDWPNNSGFWFRTQDGKGYQFDILKFKDPVAYSGTLYMPGKMFLTVNLDEALEKKEDWNEAVIRAEGNRLRIWLNGLLVGDCQDSSFRKGALGIQVHPGNEYKGRKVTVKKVEVRNLGPAAR